MHAQNPLSMVRDQDLKPTALWHLFTCPPAESQKCAEGRGAYTRTSSAKPWDRRAQGCGLPHFLERFLFLPYWELNPRLDAC